MSFNFIRTTRSKPFRLIQCHEFIHDILRLLRNLTTIIIGPINSPR
jgi:hypothetical protein